MSRRQRFGLLGGVAVLAMAIAIPVLAADPSPSAVPPGHAKAGKSAKPDKANNPGQLKKAEKAAKGPEVAVTIEGTIQQATDGQGRPSFTVTANGKTWELSAGPPWYWGDKNPLAAYAGKSVKIAGTSHEGSSELDVETIDGTAIRAAGKPPWAGGPWVVGSSHPGWKAWMADGKPGKGLGRENAPGQLKDKTGEDSENAQPGS